MVPLVKRAYESASPTDGFRLLVDRLWPRGRSHAQLRLHGWVKDVAPSTELRKWFGHDPAKWTEFKQRYNKELDANKIIVEALITLCKNHKVTLVYGARDTKHNNAVALADYISKKL